MKTNCNKQQAEERIRQEALRIGIPVSSFKRLATLKFIDSKINSEVSVSS